jgi:hypothetical protein
MTNRPRAAGRPAGMPAGARTHRLINTSRPMSFTITTDRASTPRARTLLDIFRHKRNRPNRLPRSPSCASASRAERVCPRKCVGMNERDRHAIDKQNAEEQDQ